MRVRKSEINEKQANCGEFKKKFKGSKILNKDLCMPFKRCSLDLTVKNDDIRQSEHSLCEHSTYVTREGLACSQ